MNNIALVKDFEIALTELINNSELDAMTLYHILYIRALMLDKAIDISYLEQQLQSVGIEEEKMGEIGQE